VAGLDGVLYLACIGTPNLNLHANQNIMFCAKADIPRMEFPLPTGSESPSSVPTDLQVNDISVSLVLDRGNASNVLPPDGAVNPMLTNMPGCFSGTQITTDCNVFSACLDVDMKFTMHSLQADASNACKACPAYRRSSTRSHHSSERSVRCAREQRRDDRPAVLNSASNQTTVTGPIGTNARLAPPFAAPA
jgi:hypothetical protein